VTPPRRAVPPRLLPLVLAPVFAGLSAWWLSGLIGQVSTAVPGGGAGDNLTFVWNSWWMYHVIHAGGSFFFSPLLFAPAGVDLTLHTHTALPSLLAAAIASGQSLVFGTNVMIAVHLVLNFACAFALTWRLTRDLPAALVGSIVFGCSPYAGAHLPGHFNLIAAWLLPLTALLLLLRLEEGNRASAAFLGIVLGLAAYVDYYYTVYAFALAAVFVLHRNVSCERAAAIRRPWQLPLLLVIAGLCLALLVAVIVIATSGGTVITLGSQRVSMMSTANPLAALGILAMVGAAVALLPGLRIRVDAGGFLQGGVRLTLPLAIAVVCLLPLIYHGLALWQRGDYVSQRYFWRSAPRGIDVATLLLGNPSGLLWPGVVSRAYARLGIDAVEQVAWLGPGVMALSAVALALRQKPHVRLWLSVSAVFGTWALGSSLAAFGRDTHVFLPAVLLRYVPIVANARIPARAFVLVYVAAAVLSAIGMSELRRRGRRNVAFALAALVMLDYLPRPVPVFRLDQPEPYLELGRRADGGTLCELPMGLRDGFGETGRFDSRTLTYQMIHQHPITGGFVARLSPKLLDAYERSPLLGPLLRLSAGQPLAREQLLSGDQAGAALAAAGIRYVMLNKRTAPADLAGYVRSGLPLRVISEDEERTLYEVSR
jgi:hypothetical protein